MDQTVSSGDVWIMEVRSTRSFEGLRRAFGGRRTYAFNVIRYGLGVAVPMLVTVFELAFQGYLQRATLFMFLGDVFVTAQATGTEPALLAAVLSAPLANYFFLGQGNALS